MMAFAEPTNDERAEGKHRYEQLLARLREAHKNCDHANGRCAVTTEGWHLGTGAWKMKRALYYGDADAEPNEPDTEPKRRKRKPNLASVKRQAVKAGVEVAAYEFRPDGTIGVIPGKPAVAIDVDENDDVTPEDLEQWH